MINVSFFQVIQFVWRYYGRLKGRVFMAFFAVTVSAVADLANPTFTGWLIDTITDSRLENQNKFEQAILLVFLLLAQSLIYHLSMRFAHFMNSKTAAQVEKMVAGEALERIQRFSSDWHVNSFAGSTVTKIKRAMRAVHLFFDTTCYYLYATTLIALGIIILTTLRQPVLGIIFGVFSLFFVITSVISALFFLVPANRHANRQDNKVGAALSDIITSNSTVKAFSAEKRELQFFDKISGKWMEAAKSAWMKSNFIALIQNVFMSGLKFGVLLGSVWYWHQGLFKPGDVVFILGSYQVFSGYLRTIGDRIRDIHQSVNDMEDVIVLYKTPIQVKDKSKAHALKIIKGQIVFKNVTFRYPSQPESIFENFSVEIKPGEKVALVGHSGSGKTTFVKLLQRLYDVEKGQILIDDQNISGVTQESLRKSLGIVPQDPGLFHRSLRENIAYGKPDATQKEIEKAAKEAHVFEFIQNLPQKYETLVGERGIKLSGGERQRVAIARAILANRPILILDEATSSLDSESELLIQDALSHLLEGKTAIIIAHRLSTIKSVDRILVFEGGSILEQGTHAQLVKKTHGLYRKLYHMQAGGFLGE